jgi:flagellar M-ring protein FliF
MSAAVQKGLPAGTMRESHTRNFEIDHVSDRRTLAPGAVRRLAVAVVVDGVEITDQGEKKQVPRDREQLDKIAALVRGAVGIDEKRGDILTVESVPFLAEHADAPVAVDAAKPFPIQITVKDLKDHKKVVGIGAGAFALLMVLAAVVVKRRRSRAKVAAALKESEQRTLTFGAGAAPIITPLEQSKLTPEEMRLAAHERAQLDPATAALVLKAWLGAAEGEEKLQSALAS